MTTILNDDSTELNNDFSTISNDFYPRMPSVINEKPYYYWLNKLIKKLQSIPGIKGFKNNINWLYCNKYTTLIFVNEYTENILGFITYYEENNDTYIELIQSFKKGMGKKMIQYIQSDYSDSTIYANDPLESSFGFWEKLEFEYDLNNNRFKQIYLV